MTPPFRPLPPPAAAEADPAPRPWERQVGEPPAAWEAFRTYRDLGPDRSLDAVDRQLYQQAAPAERRPSAGRRRRGHISAWSRQYRWVARAAAWQAELDRQGQQAQIDAVKEMNARHARAARALQDRAIEALQHLSAADLQAAEVLRFLIESCKLERLAVGEPTERTAQELKTEGRVLRVVERIVPVPADGPGGATPPAAAGGEPTVVEFQAAAAPLDDAELPDEPPAFARPPARR